MAIKESNCLCVWKAEPQEVDGVLFSYHPPTPPSPTTTKISFKVHILRIDEDIVWSWKSSILTLPLDCTLEMPHTSPSPITSINCLPRGNSVWQFWDKLDSFRRSLIHPCEVFLANNRLGIEFLDTSDGDAQELFLHSVAIKESNCLCVWKAKPQEVDGVLFSYHPLPPTPPCPLD